MIETVWFCLVAWMFATYAVLGGSDLGVGMVHLFVARTEAERSQVIRTIRPVWKPNEVWLIAAGGTLLFAFPTALATMFSGFYLPLLIFVWLLVFRGLGIELRYQVPDRMWVEVWDVALSLSSLLLAVFLGAAVGNVVRGVPLTAERIFFEPLWTDFLVGQETGILDWYTVLVGLLTAAALAHHGALWLNAHTDGGVEQRSNRAAGRLWVVLVMLAVATNAATFAARSELGAQVAARPWGLIFPMLTFAGLIATWLLRREGKARQAFLVSGGMIYALAATAAIGLYPHILPAREPALGLTVHDAAAPSTGLLLALGWWVPGIALVCGYFAYVYRSMPERFLIHEEDGLGTQPEDQHSPDRSRRN